MCIKWLLISTLSMTSKAVNLSDFVLKELWSFVVRILNRSNDFIDNNGKIFIWKDESEPSPIKVTQSSLMLDIANQDESESFNYVYLLSLLTFIEFGSNNQ